MFNTVSVIDKINKYLNQTQKRNILIILNQGLTSGRIGRTDYFITKENNENQENLYIVKIMQKERALIGSELKLTSYSCKVIIK